MGRRFKRGQEHLPTLSLGRTVAPSGTIRPSIQIFNEEPIPSNSATASPIYVNNLGPGISSKQYTIFSAPQGEQQTTVIRGQPYQIGEQVIKRTRVYELKPQVVRRTITLKTKGGEISDEELRRLFGSQVQSQNYS